MQQHCQESAIIGGSGLEDLLQASKIVRLETPYGTPPPISVGVIGREEVAFLPRHGPKHDVPPHKINYKANVYSLKQVGMERIIATNAVGAISVGYNPGDLAIPADILDMTKSRSSSYFDAAPVTHIDVTEPYCPELCSLLAECCRANGVDCRAKAILAATEGLGTRHQPKSECYSKLGGRYSGYDWGT